MSCSIKTIGLFISFLAVVPKGSGLKVAQTFYGFPDNDPAGPGILLDCGRGHEASGMGTFDDPLTFATAPGSFEDCEIIYDPTLKKYLIHEDFCQSCATDWTKGIWHIDVWVGQKNFNGAGDQISCENRLTSPPQKYVVRNPDPDLPVDITPLYEPGRFCKADQADYYLNLYEYNEQDFTKLASTNPAGTRKGPVKQGFSAQNVPPANPPTFNPPPVVPPPINPPASVPPLNVPPANPPPAHVPPANVSPVIPSSTNLPPVNVPPVNPPQANVPPSSVPPANTPPANPPPANIPPASPPPAVVPPAAAPLVKIPVSVPPSIKTPPPKLPPISDPLVNDPPVTALPAEHSSGKSTTVQTSSPQACVYQNPTEQDFQAKEYNDSQSAQENVGGKSSDK